MKKRGKKRRKEEYGKPRLSFTLNLTHRRRIPNPVITHTYTNTNTNANCLVLTGKKNVLFV